MRRTPDRSLLRAPRTRRGRAGIAAGAVVVLLGTAWAIGSRPQGATDRPATTSAGAGQANVATSGASDKSAPMATTTILMGAATGGGEARSADGDAAYAGEDAALAASPAGGPAVAPKIIRTGSAEVVVKRGTFDDAIARLTSVATGLGGFVSASETTSLGDDPRGTITLRVPAKEFDRALASLTRIGTVAAATTGSQDVTGEYTDVAAHISALKAEREQILLVLDRAETVPDILSVRDRLASVQAELEQLQGRQQVLDDQTSLSTLTVTVREKGSVAATTPAPERRGLAKLWHDSADRFADGVRSIALGLATLAPWLLLALVIWLPTRAWWRRNGEGSSHPGGAAPATATD